MAEQQQGTERADFLLGIWQERIADILRVDMPATHRLLVMAGMDRDDAAEAVVKIVQEELRRSSLTP